MTSRREVLRLALGAALGAAVPVALARQPRSATVSTVIPATKNEMLVEWHQEFDQSIVWWRKAGEKAWTYVGRTSSRCIPSPLGLEPGVDYTVRVRAYDNLPKPTKSITWMTP